MSIDASQVTAESLDQYENLMKGKVAIAKSNATYQSGCKSACQNDLSSIHTWRNDQRSHEREVGAFEMRFEKPTSLVSLNIDVTFECQDTRKLLHSLSPEVQSAVGGEILPEETKEEQSPEKTKIQTMDSIETIEK